LAGFARVHPWISDMPEPEPSPVFPFSVLILFGLASHGRDLQKYLHHKSHKLAFDKPCVKLQVVLENELLKQKPKLH